MSPENVEKQGVVNCKELSDSSQSVEGPTLPALEPTLDSFTEIDFSDLDTDQYSACSGNIDTDEIIIARLRVIEQKLDIHHKKAAMADQVKDQEEHLLDELRDNNARLLEVIDRLHGELRASSLRHRASVYASVAVLINTLLTLIALAFGSIRLTVDAMVLLLVVSILFWIMARTIPPVEPITKPVTNAR